MRPHARRCRTWVFLEGCPAPCALALGHGGDHEGKPDARIAQSFRADLMVLALRDRGKSLDWVAARLGVSRERVRFRERRALERIAEAGRAL